MPENIQNTREKHKKNTVCATKHLIFSIQCCIIKHRHGEAGWFGVSMNKKRRQTRQRPCYLNIVLCMICMSLKQDERAEQKFDAAWSIASREGYIHPFVEHHGILQGQVERALRKQDPETYNKIVQSVYRFSRGWMKIHNPVSTLQVTDALTPYEFSIAMLAAKGRSNKEIAALMGISVNTVKSYMESIFEKLQISSRNEIDAYVNR